MNIRCLFLAVCCLPLHHLSLSSGFGIRRHPVTGKAGVHYGIDLRARNDTVYAVCAGSLRSGYDALLGLYVQIDDGRLRCTYGHLSRLFVNSGAVSAGSPIGITGATGRVTGEHLHLGIRFGGRPLDPLVFLYQLTIKSNLHEQ